MANCATDEGSVTYNPAETSLAAVYDAIESVGYSPVCEDGDDESRRQRNLTLFGAALSLPLLAMMVGHIFASGWMETTFEGIPLGWVAFALATPVYVLLGRQYYENSWKALVRNKTANMDVLKAIRVSEATLSKIKQNLVWALGYNTAMIPLAPLGLLQPVLAAGAMAISSVSVLTNSLLFRRYTPDRDYRILGRVRP